MENGELQSLSLKLLATKKRVVFLEANKDFVDVLFSFMTIPIGTIIKLTREQSPKEKIGCLNNLYSSIESLDDKYLKSQKLRDMLLHPRSAAEICCKNLKVNLNDSDGNEYYACAAVDCLLVSYYQTYHCRCGENMVYKLKLPSPTSVPQEGEVFMKSTTCFMISDDFNVMPLSTMNALTLFRNLRSVDVNNLEERTVKVGRQEVLELLKCSLVSNTPLSEIFLQQRQPFVPPGRRILHRRYGPRSTNQSERVGDSTNKETKICLKLIVNTSINRALYAEAEEDFVDLLCSFLTFPLGYLLENFPSLLFSGCIDNLHKSIHSTEVKLFESDDMKEDLLHMKLAPGLAYDNQIINIKEAIKPSYNTLADTLKAIRSDLRSQSHGDGGEAKTGKGFIKGPSKFMVMDSLTIMPLSPISGLSLIKEERIPLGDIGEQ